MRELPSQWTQEGTPFEIRVHAPVPLVCVVRLSGEIAGTAVAQLGEFFARRLRHTWDEVMIVDLHDVGAVDAAGWQELRRAGELAAAGAVGFVLVGAEEAPPGIGMPSPSASAEEVVERLSRRRRREARLSGDRLSGDRRVWQPAGSHRGSA